MSLHDQRFGEGYYVSEAPLDERVAFIRRTYLHLAGAVLAFVALSALFYNLGVGAMILAAIAGNRYGWLLILGGFVLAGWVASSMAQSARSVGMQYAGLVLYTVAEALIFAPILFIAARYFPGVLQTAAGITIFTFAGLSVYTL